MAGLVVVATDIPWADALCRLFRAHGFAAEIRDGWEDSPDDPTVAIILSLQSWDEPVHVRAKILRDAGFKGVLMVLGRIQPDLGERQRLSESGAWFLPAFSGPEDVVSRVRMLC